MIYFIYSYAIIFVLYSIYFEFSIQDEILKNKNINDSDITLLRDLLAYDGRIRFRLCFGACNYRVWNINKRVRQLLVVRTSMLCFFVVLIAVHFYLR
jgi:hypothetical protein